MRSWRGLSVWDDRVAWCLRGGWDGIPKEHERRRLGESEDGQDLLLQRRQFVRCRTSPCGPP